MGVTSRPGRRLRLAKYLWRWRPHETQRQWLLNDAPVKVAACGRRWGKTEAAAIDAASYAVLFPGSEQIIVAPTYDQAGLIARGVERLLLDHPMLAKRTSVRKTPYPTITLGRSRIMARTADDDGKSLRGHRADRIIVDEAAFVRDSVITEVIQPMLADRDGQLVLISTPYGRNLFWRLWTAGQAGEGRIASFRFPSSDNPHISRSYIESQRKETPPKSFQAEYLAEFVESMAAVFPWDELNACRSLPAQKPDQSYPWHRRIVAGVDWARYTDFTVCVALDITFEPWQIIAIDRFQGLSWEASIERVATFMQHNKVTSALCDQTAVGDPLLEQLQNRLRKSVPDQTDIQAIGYVFSQQSKQKLIDNLALGIAHRKLSLPGAEMPNAEALLRELEIFEYELHPGGAITYSAPQGQHDDTVIALSLATWQAREAPDWAIGTSSNLNRGGVFPLSQTWERGQG